MPQQSSKKLADPEIKAPLHGWSHTSANTSPVIPSVESDLAGRTVGLVRIRICGDAIVLRVAAWSRTYDDATDADDAFAALNSKQGDLLHWSIGATAFGPTRLDNTIDDLVAAFVEKRDEERERVAGALEQERLHVETEQKAETTIAIYFREKKGCYLLVLERGSLKAKPIWTISFAESWERDRFWDWLGWQEERFEEFAEFTQVGCRLELERRLLREMLVTEQAVKKQGLGSGGRRPLRFWRGEL